MKIEDKELGEFFDTENIHYLDRVTYIPSHAKGNASHPDAEQGVIISWNETDVMVLYCGSRTVKATTPKDLVWG
ncbi:MAG: hypothetical protein ACE5GV_05975 [Candidatus Scalindua sp.]